MQVENCKNISRWNCKVLHYQICHLSDNISLKSSLFCPVDVKDLMMLFWRGTRELSWMIYSSWYSFLTAFIWTDLMLNVIFMLVVSCNAQTIFNIFCSANRSPTHQEKFISWKELWEVVKAVTSMWVSFSKQFCRSNPAFKRERFRFKWGRTVV